MCFHARRARRLGLSEMMDATPVSGTGDGIEGGTIVVWLTFPPAFTCRDKRGGIFYSNLSSSWESVGSYALGFDLRLGYSGNGDYGYEDIALTEDLVVPSQIVAVINSTDHWLGYMGLGIQETNFTEVNKLSFIGSLVQNQSLIPSHSYGYTAGAYHRQFSPSR